ncbi:hypothetical protein pb186bvf_008554 [Paramecium bursaria]
MLNQWKVNINKYTKVIHYFFILEQKIPDSLICWKSTKCSQGQYQQISFFLRNIYILIKSICNMQQQEQKIAQSDVQKIQVKKEEHDSNDNQPNNKEFTQEQEKKSIIQEQQAKELTPEDELISQFEKITITDQLQKIPEYIEKEIPQVQKEISLVQTEENSQIIKGTQRPDGTFRKDIKVKPGYKNDEMIKKYVIPQKR